MVISLVGSSGEVSGTAAESNPSPAGENATGNFVPVMKPEELPKGTLSLYH